MMWGVKPVSMLLVVGCACAAAVIGKENCAEVRHLGKWRCGHRAGRLVETSAGRTVVRVGVEFNGQGVGAEHPQGRHFRTVSDLRSIGGQGAIAFVGDLLHHEADAICPFVKCAQIYLKVELKGGAKMDGAFVPSGPSVVCRVEVSCTQSTPLGKAFANSTGPKRKR